VYKRSIETGARWSGLGEEMYLELKKCIRGLLKLGLDGPEQERRYIWN